MLSILKIIGAAVVGAFFGFVLNIWGGAPGWASSGFAIVIGLQIYDRLESIKRDGRNEY